MVYFLFCYYHSFSVFTQKKSSHKEEVERRRVCGKGPTRKPNRSTMINFVVSNYICSALQSSFWHFNLIIGLKIQTVALNHSLGFEYDCDSFVFLGIVVAPFSVSHILQHSANLWLQKEHTKHVHSESSSPCFSVPYLFFGDKKEFAKRSVELERLSVIERTQHRWIHMDKACRAVPPSS